MFEGENIPLQHTIDVDAYNWIGTPGKLLDKNVAKTAMYFGLPN